MRKLSSAVVVAVVTFGLASPAWGGGPPTHDEAVYHVDDFAFPSGNPCTGDSGTVILHEVWRFKTLTFPDGTSYVRLRTTGTFDFVPDDPSKPTYYAVHEDPSTTQTKLDANGNGSQTFQGGYLARGSDGSRVRVHEVAHFTVVGGVFTPTVDHAYLHCLP
jgi:hypothetical protein